MATKKHKYGEYHPSGDGRRFFNYGWTIGGDGTRQTVEHWQTPLQWETRLQKTRAGYWHPPTGDKPDIVVPRKPARQTPEFIPLGWRHESGWIFDGWSAIPGAGYRALWADADRVLAIRASKGEFRARRILDKRTAVGRVVSGPDDKLFPGRRIIEKHTREDGCTVFVCDWLKKPKVYTADQKAHLSSRSMLLGVDMTLSGKRLSELPEGFKSPLTKTAQRAVAQAAKKRSRLV